MKPLEEKKEKIELKSTRLLCSRLSMMLKPSYRIHVHDGETKNESYLPIILSILAVATIMGVTFGMLYWNYCEQQNGDLNIQNI